MGLWQRFISIFKSTSDEFPPEAFTLGGDVDSRTQGMAGVVMRTIWSYVAIRTIVNNARAIPITPEVMGEDGRWVEVTTEDPLYRLVSDPNPFQMWDDFMEATICYLKIFGDVPVHIQRTGGVPTSFYPMRPDLTTLNATTNKIVAGWEFDRGAGRPETFSPEDVLMIREFNPEHPIRGFSPSRAAQQSLLADFHAAKYNVRFFSNHALPGVVLQTDVKMPATVRRRLRANMRAAFGGSDKAHGLAILSKGLEIKTVTPSHRDMDFGELSKDAMVRTLLAFGVPPGVVGITSELTNSNLQEQRHLFLVNTLQPTVDNVLQKLNKAVFNPIGMRLRANFEGVLISAQTLHDRKMEHRGMWRDGLITRDESRVAIGFPAVGGDVGAEFYPVTASKAASPELGDSLNTEDTFTGNPDTGVDPEPSSVAADPDGTIKGEAPRIPLSHRLPFEYFNKPQNGTMPPIPSFEWSPRA